MEDEAEESVCGFGFGGRGADEDQRSAKESDMVVCDVWMRVWWVCVVYESMSMSIVILIVVCE